MNIYLWGLPGSGKSHIGRYLADELEGWVFWDNDAMVEQHTGCSIPELFAEKGEDFFRATERDVLYQTDAKHVNLVVALGGGAPCFFDNALWMLDRGLVFFLNPPLDLILKRLTAGPHSRPMFLGKTAEEQKLLLEKLYATRLPFYQKAHHTLTETDDFLLIEGIKRRLDMRLLDC